MPNDIPLQKDKFSIPDDSVYLNCAYMAPQLKHVSEAGVQAVLSKETPWKLSVEDFFEPAEHARKLVAEMIGSKPDDIAFIPAVSYGIAVAANNININTGDEIVILAEQFPSNVYSWMELTQEKSAKLIQVPLSKDRNLTDSILNTITADTAIVAVPHCHWTDGRSIDLILIREACDKVNAALVIDATQSLGAKPFSVQEIRPDFLVCAGYKWLLGPYSYGFMYVSPKYQEGKPLEHNWINREHSENFAGLVNYKSGFQKGARRFDSGERSNFILLPMFIKALQQILEWGIENIEFTISKLTNEIRTQALLYGLTATPQAYGSSHMLGVRFEQGVPEHVVSALKGAQIYVSVRGNSIRISPHVYNSMDDIHRLFDVLKKTI